MSASSSGKRIARRLPSRPVALLGAPLWVTVSYIAATAAVVGVSYLIKPFLVLSAADQAVAATLSATTVYLLALAFAIGIPRLVSRRYVTTKRELGLSRLPSWLDIVLAPAGLVAYFFTATMLLVLASAVFPGLDANEAQQLPFSTTAGGASFALAFLTLVVIAPLAEEVLFRGYLYGKLRRIAPVWLAAIITSLLFGLAHLQWNVAIDVFAMSLIMCLFRETTGTIWVGVLMHMMKNGIAFYFLFINPTIIGG